jgi:hypothetical protein
MPSKKNNTPEPASPAKDYDNFENDFPPLSELRRSAEKNAKNNNIVEIFESENESSLGSSNNESSSNNNDENQE